MKEAILWRSQLYSGHDYCNLQQSGNTWKLNGTALLTFNDVPSRFNYAVSCNHNWQTTSASIEGIVGDKNIRVLVEVSETADWIINGQIQDDLKGCLDVDLGFTPATNTLPIRRLRLAVGESEITKAAWLKMPDFTFSVLDQKYSRTAESEYLYESGNGRYSTTLTVNRVGFVTNYPSLWSLECAT